MKCCVAVFLGFVGWAEQVSEVQPPVLPPVFSEVLTFYDLLQKAVFSNNAVLQPAQSAEAMQSPGASMQDALAIGQPLWESEDLVRRPPLLSVLTDAIRGLLSLQGAVVNSAVRHNPFVKSEIPFLRVVDKMNSVAIEGQAADLGAGVDNNPFAQLTQNAVEILVDSLLTNAKFWSIPVQQAGSLVHDLFAGLAEVTTQLSPNTE
eukprot:Gregarina_sp_Pseudo_9__150@NODE_1100_length_1878_cov_35_642197_g1028_i0_p2_GENE_NODE_1100_length_1878_cov_35_642197_g1028_i0NODE_1100_length_1878_cov_35_642197_g1028_i0_p2_ORF_typecomplete_len205_score33_10_NODE_1100_length_1878_cov_35_642197_g1028_i09841598